MRIQYYTRGYDMTISELMKIHKMRMSFKKLPPVETQVAIRCAPDGCTIDKGCYKVYLNGKDVSAYLWKVDEKHWQCEDGTPKTGKKTAVADWLQKHNKLP